MHQNGGDNLRMFVADNIGHSLRLHIVEAFDPGRTFVFLEDIFQQAGGTVFTQRLDQHGTQIIIGIYVQRRILNRRFLKLRQDFRQLGVGDLTHVGHRHAQLLNFFIIQVVKDLGGLVLTERHQHDGALFCSA